MILHWLQNLDRRDDLISTQQQLIETLRNDLLRTELAHTRISRDLIEQFLITLDRPDLQDSARDGLFRARMEFMDHVARLEEQLT